MENDSLPASTPLDIPLSENDTYTQPNILRVSELENPFVFPSEQTYTISNGEITGIATITAALSEGQFGEFPLYVFTEEGIWALQNGNGIVCYGAQHQLNREPILPENPIVPLARHDYVYYGKRIIYHTRLRNTTTLIVRTKPPAKTIAQSITIDINSYINSCDHRSNDFISVYSRKYHRLQYNRKRIDMLQARSQI